MEASDQESRAEAPRSRQSIGPQGPDHQPNAEAHQPKTILGYEGDQTNPSGVPEMEPDEEIFCYAPLLIFGARATYLSHFVSSMTAYHLCVLPAHLSALPDSFRT